MKNFNRKPIALFQQVEKSTNLYKFVLSSLESLNSKKLEKLFERFREKAKKRSNLLSELKRAYPEKPKIGASISEGDCFFDSLAQGLNELNIKPGHRFTAKSLREDCENYARANADLNSWVYKKITGDAEEGGYFVGEGNLDSKVIAKERNSEDEKGISAQTDWCKDEEIITKYTEEEFFSWLLEEYREDREGKILEILKSRYGTDNDLLLEDYDEYETSKDKEEEISEDGKEKGEKVTIKDNSNSFSKYLNNIKNMSTETNSLAIWGRPEIEGRMICDKYKVELYIYSIEEDSQKVTVTKITGHDDDPEVFIQDINLNQLEIDSSKKTVGVVNYMRHFVPLLSEISEDITESQPVSNEEIFGEVKEVPASEQPKQEVQYNIITSKSAIVQDHETQKERINTSASEPIHTDTVITISHQQGQETQQEAIEKKLINSCYRREAIYSIAAVITAIAFTAFATVAIFTQPIPLACLAGVALAIACVCVYQLTQSHQDINELKGKVGENNTFTFLEETGFKIYSLIDKAASKI
ncbi:MULTISPECIES: OTU domain-containing protein [unclassified Wolbachia]|uniref:hypothetical protein n=1 Tax=unclassified Wolbachia TaxID=2640676 RepID=UPI002225D071|nr:hypothetical protein [Wolbachia endosymbiont (group B) of Euphydryas aurinia]